MSNAVSYLLVMLQWLLVVLGGVVVFLALTIYLADLRHLSALPPATPDGSYYVLRPLGNLSMGVAIGLCTTGLGCVLFYLRHLFVSRRQRP